MVVNEPTVGNKASMVAAKASTARGPMGRWVESRYALQGMNKNWEKQQAGNLGQRKASDLWKDVGKHINGGVRKICKEVVN